MLSTPIGHAARLPLRWRLTCGLRRAAGSFPAGNGALGRTIFTTSSFSLGHAERRRIATHLGLNPSTSQKAFPFSLYSTKSRSPMLEPTPESSHWKRSYRTSSPISWPTSSSTTTGSTSSTPYNYAGAGTFASALRKPGLYSKLWFRKDGSPRSKLKGLLIASMSIGTLCLIYALMLLIEQYETAAYLLLCLIHIQRTDADSFSSLDLTSLQSLSAYFQELCHAFEDIPTHLIDDLFQDIAKLQGRQAEGAQAVMREVAEKIHRILVGSKGKVPWETAGQAILVIDEGLMKLLLAVEEDNEIDGEGKRKVDEEVEARKAQRNQQIKEKIKDQTARGGSGEYEVLG